MCSRCFQFLSSVAGQAEKPTWFCEDDESNDEDAEAGSGAAQGDDVAANVPRRSDASATGDHAPLSSSGGDQRFAEGGATGGSSGKTET
jgi:hypothetical protein